MDSKQPDYSETLNRVSTNSKPSELRITDIKICKVDLPPWGSHLVKFETNQGISGFGEMRDGASATYLKMLKSRLVGENPCDADRLFRKIKQFGGPSRQSAGVCAAELALWDLAGKAYGVPVYQLIGGRFRDEVRLYGDIHIEDGRFTGRLMDPKDVGAVLKGYMDQGFTVLKILSVELLTAKEGNCGGPLDWVERLRAAEERGRKVALAGDRAATAKANAELYDFNKIAHPFTNMHITEQGLDELEAYVEQVRSVIGYKVPLAIDHFGHFPLPDMVKIARRMERFNLAWLEDLLPWYLTDQYKVLKQSTTAPIATGEDMYLAESFEPLLAAGALDLVHPDILTSGGILETKRLGDLAAKYGASMAVHMCESPIASTAAAHMATATENFFALEYDAFDSPWWEDLIIGPARPLVQNGFIRVSDAPGLGIEALNEDLIREHGPIKEKNIWVSTDDWNGESSLDRIWS
ncbi:mandelate racemase/muconate lactonizing enzyme family protein [Breznakiella homolactica]|uniref:Mandelate racemase/muconate lactonizing enzyme family protein n=1 Tax=Breznakiella homolactica TaxID=2798577 RepID=A0A7T7XRN1_9SPIR|nr:mandelate racemase/muconate lactonizing enzyme family protein [Breznakiella homolactica]QQO11245.1 mandelate racemase/muconate lactonizing enzyme family protein [Breznakiella homolactica]